MYEACNSHLQRGVLKITDERYSALTHLICLLIDLFFCNLFSCDINEPSKDKALKNCFFDECSIQRGKINYSIYQQFLLVQLVVVQELDCLNTNSS